MDQTEIIHNFARESENITLNYILFLVDMYADQPEKIKELIQERIDKNNSEMIKDK